MTTKSKKSPTRPRRAGRPRCERTHRAILQAAMDLLEAQGYQRVTVEAIAAEAGVGKQTIYRWWPGKADVVLEAFAGAAAAEVAEPDTGSLERDLVQFVTATFRAARRWAPVLRNLMAEVQFDAEFAERFRSAFIHRRRAALLGILDRGRSRGELSRSVDDQLLADLLYGPMWYRLLLGHGPLDAALARTVVAAALAVGGAGAARQKKSRIG